MHITSLPNRSRGPGGQGIPSRIALWALLWMCLACGAFANPGKDLPPIRIDGDPNTLLFLLQSSEVLNDPGGEFTAESLFSNPAISFTPLPAESTTFSAPPGVYWIRFSLANDSDWNQRLWLGTESPSLDQVALYKHGSAEPPLKGGSRYINPEWEKPERLHFLPVELRPGEQALFLLRIESRVSVRISPKIYSDHSFVVHAEYYNTQLGIFCGILVTLFIFALNLFSSLRDKIFVFYLLYIVALGLLVMSSMGIVSVLFPGHHTLPRVALVFGSLLNLFANTFFIRYFLQLPDNNPWLDKTILTVGIAPIVIFAALPFTEAGFERLFFWAGAAVLVVSVISGIRRLMQNYRPAVYILAAHALMLTPLVALRLFPETILPNATMTTALVSATVIKALVLGCGLSALVDTLNRELSREVAQRTVRESQLMQAQQIAQYGDWRWNTHTQQFSFSQSALDILPKLPVEGGNDFERLLKRATTRQREVMRTAFSNAVETQRGFDTEFSLLHDDGTTHYYFTRAEFQRDDKGLLTPILIGTIHDITDRKLADIAYRENEQRWRELADSTFEAILIYQEGVIIDANQACEDLLGYSPTKLIGTSGEAFVDKEHLSEFLDNINYSSNEPFELPLITLRGNPISAEIRSRTGSFNQQQVQIVALRDVTERLQHEEQLKQLGYYDSLTGLANRTLFQERLQRAIDKALRYAQNHALLFIDLDQFKHVNDSLGHDIGDQLLVEVGNRLKTRVRKVDTVARLGGDEFAILVEDITAPYIAAKVAEEILSVMSEPVLVDEFKLMVTPSIGIALFPSDGSSGTELLRKADTAMYHAKSLGRNNYQFYTEALNEKMVRRMDLESELRLAIERAELSLHYQPKVDLNTGDIVGAEALLRWHSKKFGIVPPDEFISIAEETGLIWPIGELTLELACDQAMRWRDSYSGFDTVAVNISGIQFNQGNLEDIIARVLEKTGIPPQHLELEITEGAIINNAEEAIKVMVKLKELGVKLSLDDFGTGYSSLSYLKRFPVDSLKIDRSFVAEIVSDRTDQKIAENIVKLAHDLSLIVVAEGVETTEQLEMIREMRCDQLQGYIFSKPLPSDQMETMLAKQNNLYKDPDDSMSVSNQ